MCGGRNIITKHKPFDELSTEQINLLRSLLIMHDEFGLGIYKNFVRSIVDDDDELPTNLEGSD